jgi:hypothetical protein
MYATRRCTRCRTYLGDALLLEDDLTDTQSIHRSGGSIISPSPPIPQAPPVPSSLPVSSTPAHIPHTLSTASSSPTLSAIPPPAVQSYLSPAPLPPPSLPSFALSDVKDIRLALNAVCIEKSRDNLQHRVDGMEAGSLLITSEQVS